MVILQSIPIDVTSTKPNRVPPNCTFEIDDYEQDWLYTRKTDFIHGRELNGFVADYDRLFRQAFECLKPGGWLEMQTAAAYFYSDDGTAEQAKYSQMWLQHIREAAEKFGKSFYELPKWKEKMEKAGFVDVKDVPYKVC